MLHAFVQRDLAFSLRSYGTFDRARDVLSGESELLDVAA